MSLSSEQAPQIAISGSSGWVGGALMRKLSDEAHFAAVGLVRNKGEKPYTVPEGTTHVVHLAALVHQMSNTPSLEDYRFANRELTLKLAQEAASKGVRSFIFVSTAKVMGDSSIRPFTENDPPCPPDDYSLSKWEAEQALESMQREGALKSMKITVLRPPLIYGDGAGANYAKLVALAESNWPLPFGSAKALRSMIAVDRFNGIIVSLLQPTIRLDEYSVFFATDEKDTSVASLIRNIRHKLGHPARLIAVPKPLMKTGLTILGKKPIYDRLYTPLQFDGGRLNELLKRKAAI